MTAMAGNQEEDLAASLLVIGEENEKMGIDEMLEKYAGELGPWQLRHFVLTNLAWVLEAFHAMVIIFSDNEPAWRCTGGAPDCYGAPSVCGLPVASWKWVKGRGASTVSEWGLVCGEKYKVGLVQSAFFVGSMIGIEPWTFVQKLSGAVFIHGVSHIKFGTSKIAFIHKGCT